MNQDNLQADARRLITESCLIAADIDKTLLTQDTEGERQHFLRAVAPQLIQAASLGTHLAFLTGNSMNQLTTRFLKWLLSDLCHTESLDLLDRFHFFCNSGGVYAHYLLDDEQLCSLMDRGQASEDRRAREIFEALTFEVKNGDQGKKQMTIHPRFIDPVYIQRTRIPAKDLDTISGIMKKHAHQYTEDLDSNRGRYEQTYHLGQVTDCRKGKLIHPDVDLRRVWYGQDPVLCEATVQISLKPILSFHHARGQGGGAHLVGKDKRSDLVRDIQSELDGRGLGRYVARPGGQSTIDVTLEKLDKAYALEFIIDHLNLQGQRRQGREFGSNAIYLGDEVLVGGGNDYPVTRIPGLLVFAVNLNKELVPFQSGIFVPSRLYWGPVATVEVLTCYNGCAQKLLEESVQQASDRGLGTRSRNALEALKATLFGARIQDKIELLKRSETITMEDWQALHAFVTLMSRDDPAGRGWLSILIQMLDAIMIQLGAYEKVTPPGIGHS